MCPPTAVGHGIYNPAVVAHGDLFLEWRSTTQTLRTRTHTHPYEYTYANPTLWAPPKDWTPTDLEIPEVTNGHRRRQERRLPLNA
jgi:hypothetical protein